jgi:hypothetical protein
MAFKLLILNNPGSRKGKVCDLSLPKKIRKIIQDAITEGKLTQDQIDRSYSKIIELKNKL